MTMAPDGGETCLPGPWPGRLRSPELDSRFGNRRRNPADRVLGRESLHEMLDAMFEGMECEAEDRAEYCTCKTIVSRPATLQDSRSQNQIP